VSLSLRSPAFADGAPIPPAFDHDSGDRSPPLQWDGVPDATAELVLLVDDPDAPIQGSFVHWVLCGLDPGRRGLRKAEVAGEAVAGANGFGVAGYLGPAPPPGDPPHRYVFRLLALDAPLELGELPSYAQVEAAAERHLLAEARLHGTYQR
jgi:Raf kinase inhibitor-like YbhB/YbcL family protein